jgi:hypothetical protein
MLYLHILKSLSSFSSLEDMFFFRLKVCLFYGMTLISFFKETVVPLHFKPSLYSDPGQRVCMINKVSASLVAEGTEEAKKLNKKAAGVLAFLAKRE